MALTYLFIHVPFIDYWNNYADSGYMIIVTKSTKRLGDVTHIKKCVYICTLKLFALIKFREVCKKLTLLTQVYLISRENGRRKPFRDW